jgi:hypothetical protein
MISSPTKNEKALIFDALAYAIKANSGIGFRNSDQGHPAYMAGATNEDSETWGDSAEQNLMFKLLASFDRESHGNGPNLSTWEKFCKYAVDAHNRALDQADS